MNVNVCQMFGHLNMEAVAAKASVSANLDFTVRELELH